MRTRIPVRIRHKATGRYLTSTPSRYAHPHGSNQQIVVCVEEPSENSLWFFKFSHDRADETSIGQTLNTGEAVRVEHVTSGKNLHSHEMRSPVSRQREVSAYGAKGVGDANDNWELSILGSPETHEIRLKHTATGHWLHSHPGQSNQYTEGFQEVTCFAGDDGNNEWTIEEVDAAPIEASPVITVQIPNRSETITFYSIDSIANWLRKLENSFSWVQTKPPLPLGNTVRSHISTAFAALHTKVNSARSSVDTSQFEDSLKATKETVESALSSPKALWPESEEVLYFKALTNENLEAGISAFAAWLELDGDFSSRNGILGVLIAAEYEGALGHVEARDESLTLLSNRWHSQFAMIEKEYLARNDRAKEMQAAIDQWSKESARRVEAFIATGESNLKAIAATYDKHMSLKASVDYWSQKATRHSRLAFWFALAAIVFGFAIALMLYSAITQLATEAAATLKASSAGKGLPDEAATGSPLAILYWQFATIVALATFSIWGLRIIVKLLMSNLHQREDAEERVTMMKTFLALKREQTLEKKEDMQLILESLFRPGTSGLLKDDSSPATPFEVIMKNFDRR